MKPNCLDNVPTRGVWLVFMFVWFIFFSFFFFSPETICTCFNNPMLSIGKNMCIICSCCLCRQANHIPLSLCLPVLSLPVNLPPFFCLTNSVSLLIYIPPQNALWEENVIACPPVQGKGWSDEMYYWEKRCYFFHFCLGKDFWGNKKKKEKSSCYCLETSSQSDHLGFMLSGLNNTLLAWKLLLFALFWQTLTNPVEKSK